MSKAGQKEKKPQAKKDDPKEKEKDVGTLGIEASKSKDFPNWYKQVLTRAEMIEYYDISGCYILRPWAFSIWEQITEFFDGKIKRSGVKNAYFPLFVSAKALCKEKDHVEGFAPEVAWVTKSGSSDLDQPIAVRPTSETIMYPAYSKWIRSHRDLPLRLNQWTNVVRWEFKCPTPFIRTREFLWQEGHSAFASKEEAEAEVVEILEYYAQVYEDLLAVPVTKGKKTENEKFAGALYTTSVETFVTAVGRGVQAATSHCLGTNFAKMFDITFEDHDGQRKLAWQNSWGLSTRTLGILVMVHGDDKGLVLPPRVAPIQVVIVPIFFQTKDDLTEKAHELEARLTRAGIRVFADVSTTHKPGWKYNQWEMKGVPVRLELGPKDLEKRQVVLARRDNGEKQTISWDSLESGVKEALFRMQGEMLSRARANIEGAKVHATSWEPFIKALNARQMAMIPWCGKTVCEEDIKQRTAAAAEDEPAPQPSGSPDEEQEIGEKLSGAAKSLCVPLDQPDLPSNATCVGCKQHAICWALFGRSY